MQYSFSFGMYSEHLNFNNITSENDIIKCVQHLSKLMSLLAVAAITDPNLDSFSPVSCSPQLSSWGCCTLPQRHADTACGAFVLLPGCHDLSVLLMFLFLKFPLSYTSVKKVFIHHINYLIAHM